MDHGLFEGYPVKPQDPITRAATAKIFALAYDLEGTDANFSDLNKAPWAIEFIKALASNNIVNAPIKQQAPNVLDHNVAAWC